MLNTDTQNLGDSLAADANFGSRAPWYMFRNYRERPEYKAMPEDLKPLADRFMTDGFLVLENSIADDLCDEIVADFNSFTKRYADYFDPHRDEHGHLQRIVNLHLAMTSLLKLFSRAGQNLRFQDAAFGAPTSIYTSLYYERGSTQDIHRDTPYFCTRPEFLYFGTWFALEDADLDNGCLEVMRGGHLVPEFDRAQFCVPLYGSPENVPSVPQELFDQYQASMQKACIDHGLVRESVPIKKGSILIWHPQLPHGGGPIRKPGRTRHSIVMHTAPVGAAVYKADVFFNPRLDLPEQAYWNCGEFEGRKHAIHEFVDVAHAAPRAYHTFK